MIAVFAPLDSNESAYPHANKLRGFVRISPERKSSKIEKPDNKPITGIFGPWFSGVVIDCQSTLGLDLHPAWLEPATL